jgi:hypothetical protein
VFGREQTIRAEEGLIPKGTTWIKAGAVRFDPAANALDPRVPRRSAWYLKTKFLPWLYWSHMLVGGEFDIPHKERAFGAS